MVPPLSSYVAADYPRYPSLPSRKMVRLVHWSVWQAILTFKSQTGYVLQISVIQFCLVKKNISDICNYIFARTNDVTFAIHVYGVCHDISTIQ